MGIEPHPSLEKFNRLLRTAGISLVKVEFRGITKTPEILERTVIRSSVLFLGILFPVLSP